MSSRYLRPIKDKQVYSRKVAAAISRSFDKVFFGPLFGAVDQILEYYNDASILIEAILKHRIQYVDGGFVGSFNAAISKELTSLGAKFNKRSKKYVIDRVKLPVEVRHAIAVASLASVAIYKKVLEFLDSFDPSTLFETLNKELDVPLDEILDDMDDQKKATIEEAIKVKVQMSDSERQKLKKAYTDNLELPIKNFTQKQTSRLREMVQKSLFEGLEDGSLVNAIQKEFNVKRSKAMFWARQETGLLVSAYRRITYQTVGITKYKWSTSHDERVRTTHRDLDGKTFSFDDPPVTNEKGDRNNPGEDWQCRCQPIPVFEK